jgi:hypothetical protein
VSTSEVIMVRADLKVGSKRSHIAIAATNLASKYDFELDIDYSKADIEAEAHIYSNNKKIMIVYGSRILTELEDILERNWN